MKMEKLGLVALIATSLVGCEQQSEQERMESYVRDEAAAQATRALNADRAELDDALRTAQAQDPRVVDAYFTFNEKGEKQLNLIREKDDDSGEAKLKEWETKAAKLKAYWSDVEARWDEAMQHLRNESDEGIPLPGGFGIFLEAVFKRIHPDHDMWGKRGEGIAYFCNQMSVRTILSGMAKNNCDYSYLQKTLNEIYTKV